MNPPQTCWPLPAAELAEWIALRRVRGRGVAHYGSGWVDLERPVPSYLVEPLDELRRRRLVVLVWIPACCLRRAVLTRDGAARYDALCERRGIAPTRRALRRHCRSKLRRPTS